MAQSFELLPAAIAAARMGGSSIYKSFPHSACGRLNELRSLCEQNQKQLCAHVLQRKFTALLLKKTEIDT